MTLISLFPLVSALTFPTADIALKNPLKVGASSTSTLPVLEIAFTTDEI